jgi:hypothetical protein
VARKVEAVEGTADHVDPIIDGGVHSELRTLCRSSFALGVGGVSLRESCRKAFL